MFILLDWYPTLPTAGLRLSCMGDSRLIGAVCEHENMIGKADVIMLSTCSEKNHGLSALAGGAEIQAPLFGARVVGLAGVNNAIAGRNVDEATPTREQFSKMIDEVEGRVFSPLLVAFFDWVEQYFLGLEKWLNHYAQSSILGTVFSGRRYKGAS